MKIDQVLNGLFGFVWCLFIFWFVFVGVLWCCVVCLCWWCLNFEFLLCVFFVRALCKRFVAWKYFRWCFFGVRLGLSGRRRSSERLVGKRRTLRFFGTGGFPLKKRGDYS